MFAPSDLFSVRGRTALVTGGATGLGRVCAEALLTAGARVLIASRKAEACEAAAKELSAIGPCEGFGGTVATETGVAELAAETRKRADALHILVNNAGLTWGQPFEAFPWKAFGPDSERQRDRAFRPDARARADAVRLRHRRAAVERRQFRLGDGDHHPVGDRLFLCRLQGRRAPSDAHPRSRFAGRQVTVNAIAPGPFPTNMTRFALGDEKGAERGASTVPMRRLGRPEDIAGAILFLTGRGAPIRPGRSCRSTAASA